MIGVTLLKLAAVNLIGTHGIIPQNHMFTVKHAPSYFVCHIKLKLAYYAIVTRFMHTGFLAAGIKCQLCSLKRGYSHQSESTVVLST